MLPIWFHSSLQNMLFCLIHDINKSKADSTTILFIHSTECYDLSCLLHNAGLFNMIWCDEVFGVKLIVYYAKEIHKIF